MKKKKFKKEENLSLLDQLTLDEQSKTVGGKVHVQIMGSIKVTF